MILADFCKNNYKKHSDELVIELERKCDLMMQCLDMEFGSIAEFTKPKAESIVAVAVALKSYTVPVAESNEIESLQYDIIFGIVIDVICPWESTEHGVVTVFLVVIAL